MSADEQGYVCISQAEAIKSAAKIVTLEDRLTRIESLARHAIAAKPRDLEETWFRVEQIAGTEGG
jgi:hypothetical protein